MRSPTLPVPKPVTFSHSNGSIDFPVPIPPPPPLPAVVVTAQLPGSVTHAAKHSSFSLRYAPRTHTSWSRPHASTLNFIARRRAGSTTTVGRCHRAHRRRCCAHFRRLPGQHDGARGHGAAPWRGRSRCRRATRSPAALTGNVPDHR